MTSLLSKQRPPVDLTHHTYHAQQPPEIFATVAKRRLCPWHSPVVETRRVQLPQSKMQSLLLEEIHVPIEPPLGGNSALPKPTRASGTSLYATALVAHAKSLSDSFRHVRCKLDCLHFLLHASHRKNRRNCSMMKHCTPASSCDPWTVILRTLLMSAPFSSRTFSGVASINS